MALTGSDEVGLKSDGMKDCVARETRPNIAIAGGGAVYGAQGYADLGGKGRIGTAFSQLSLPNRLFIGTEVGHYE